MPVTIESITAIAEAYTEAWNSGSPEAVASFFAEDGGIVINQGTPWHGRAGVAEMAAGFFAVIPDLKLTCDAVRCAGNHAVYSWTFTGTYVSTNRPLHVIGWEEWDLDAHLKIAASRGWFDADDYTRQTGA